MDKSRKIYLIYTSNNRFYPHFPNSVLVLASELLKAGFQPKIIDTELGNWQKYDFGDALFVGISTFTGYWLKTALVISRKIRTQWPKIPIFWGGPHVVALPEVTIRHELVDVVCYGEGEKVIVTLANAVLNDRRDYSKINGIIYKNASGEIIKNDPGPLVNMDGIDFLPYNLLNLALYPIKHGRVYYESSRGCVFKCRFCDYDHRTRWRGKSVEKVINEFKKIVTFFNPEEILILDAYFFGNIKRAEEICKRKIECGLQFRWNTSCRFDTLSKMSDEMLILLKKSGCFGLTFGGESGSIKVQRYIDKEITREQILSGVRKCLKHRITPTVAFMTGFPIETSEDLNETLNLIDLLQKEYHGVEINGLRLLQHFPDTPLTQEIVENYNIHQPSDLEGWIKYDVIWPRRSNYPWLSNSEYSLRRTLSAIVNYNYVASRLLNFPWEQRKGTALRSSVIFGLFKFLDKIVQISVYLRWSKKIVRFPLEWKLWDLIRRHVLHAC